jgi:hypothetical protein
MSVSFQHRKSPSKKKPPEGGSINLNTLIVDQAAINAGFDLRGQAMKPMPANPRIIMPM